MPDETSDTDEPMRDRARKGALAAGTAVLGTAAMGSAAAQQDNRALVFAYDYHPGLEFSVQAPLQTSISVDILDGPDDEGIPEISQPDEWNGYVISYALGEEGTMFGYLFTRQSLNADQRFTLSGDAQVFSTQLNLLQASLSEGGADGAPEETPSPPEGTPSPPEQTPGQPGGTPEGGGQGG